MNKCIGILLFVLLSSCSSSVNEKEFLTRVSGNLDKIRSASYISTGSASFPGDTARFSEPSELYYKIFVNPSDSLVGSSSARFSVDDTTKMTDFYDGKVRGKVYWDEQYVKVDSFQDHPYPFRLVYYPFYTKINELIKYTLSTEDSIRTDFQDHGDSVFFSLKIINKHVYFHIKPIVIENEYIPEDEISQYDIWFKKSDHMPYRMRSKWHHTTAFESCSHALFNTEEDILFEASDYYPSHFEIVQFKRETREKTNTMLGKEAPDWILSDIEFNEVKLSELKSKVLLVQFTGVGCGPCHHAVPFLKQLVKDYKSEDFEFICIETWSKNMEGLQRYKQKNELNFRFLKSTDEVTGLYEVSSVPTFFIIDENRIIRKVVNGYSKGKTDNEIIESIELLL